MAPLRAALCLLLLPGVLAGDDCDAYVDSNAQWHTKQYCTFSFCCGTCNNRYCCVNPFDKLEEDQFMCSVNSGRPNLIPDFHNFMGKGDDQTPNINRDFHNFMNTDHFHNFGTFVAVGITIFVVFIVTVILCFTCSCCCLYKMCRRSPQPVVTTTSTVIHAPYPQQQAMPQNYPAAAPYPGYQPLPVQPSHMYPGGMPAGGMPAGGMPTAPYPTQYPPPYPSQVSGPPGYHETMATGSGVPYPVAQPPYNPAYVDSPKQAY